MAQGISIQVNLWVPSDHRFVWPLLVPEVLPRRPMADLNSPPGMKVCEGYNLEKECTPEWEQKKTGYVILGKPSDWCSIPLRLTVIGQTVDGNMEQENLVARGLKLHGGKFSGLCPLEDHSVEVLLVNVTSMK